jgi:hypothetical protein
MVSSSNESAITRWLSKNNTFWFTVFASFTAFALYTCVYAFRKTFPAATFEGLSYLGINYKAWLVIFQVVGYGMSKFIGIKVISELKAHSRSFGILLMVGIAGISWLFFAIVPPPYNIIFLFTNGLPLGMIWGMVFGYLEGRRTTDVLGASLSVSFIFSAGLCRFVGSSLLLAGVSEFWMPFLASCIFFLPLLIFLYLLDKVPPPSKLDEQLRTKREPMDLAQRKKFVSTFLPGIVLFVLAYMLLTAFRDARDNFSADVWNALGYGNKPDIFLTTEVPISIGVLIVMGSVMIIRNNKLALMINHLIIILGMLLIGVSTYLFSQQMIGPISWMTLIGLGLYLGYIPFNSIFFDRLIAAFSYIGTVGFIMYVADSFGYLGSIVVVLVKELGLANLSWLDFFISSGYVISVAGTLLITGSMIYFHKKHQSWTRE